MAMPLIYHDVSIWREQDNFTMSNVTMSNVKFPEAYTAYECMTQCSSYFSDTITRFTRLERNLDGQLNSLNGYSIFSHGINLLGASKLHYEDKDYDSMVWFVLNNCEEVDEYKE
jgi:hypothetical protein